MLHLFFERERERIEKQQRHFSLLTKCIYIIAVNWVQSVYNMEILENNVSKFSFAFWPFHDRPHIGHLSSILHWTLGLMISPPVIIISHLWEHRKSMMLDFRFISVKYLHGFIYRYSSDGSCYKCHKFQRLTICVWREKNTTTKAPINILCQPFNKLLFFELSLKCMLHLMTLRMHHFISLFLSDEIIIDAFTIRCFF